MSFAGHVFDMIARMKDNSSLIKKRSFFRTKQSYTTAHRRSDKSHRELTNEEKLQIKNIVLAVIVKT